MHDAQMSVSAPNLDEEAPKRTIFYLAYGSNLSAETFLGVRGIRPLSQQNVHCPSLTLTFDLPGVPYVEPCFANTRLTNPEDSPRYFAKRHAPVAPAAFTSEDNHKTRWTKGLIGVVYEVTKADFMTIIATEGGGTAYQDITILCHPLPKGTTVVPEHPGAEPLIAHTLFCPQRPGLTRPDPNYAQPSPRYLNLITSGASEHQLPAEYREYLAGLRPYRATSVRQKIGKAIFVATWLPVFAAIIGMSKVMAGKNGRVPAWYGKCMDVLTRCVWGSYDHFYKRIYGDGERTTEDAELAFEKGIAETADPAILLYQDEKRTLLEKEQDILESVMA